MKRMKKPKKLKSKSMASLVLRSEEAKWVTDMRAHYRQTGTYRAEDVRRVLGGPLEQVSGEEPSVFALACGLAHK